MKAIKMRPFAFSCILFLFTSLLLFRCSTAVKLSALCVFAVCELFLTLLPKPRRLLYFYILPPLIIASAVSFLHYGIGYGNVISYSDRTCESEFYVKEVEYEGDYSSSYIIAVTKADGKKVSFNALLYTDEHLEGGRFSSHRGYLTFKKQDPAGGETVPRGFYLSKNVYLSAAHSDDIQNLNKEAKPFPDYTFNKINEYLSGILGKYSNGDEYDLIDTVLLGNRGGLDKKHTSNFRKLGLSHVLAVSGMHLSILIGFANKMLEKVSENEKLKRLLLIVLTLCYAGITGFSPSIKRAAIMLVIYYASFLLSDNSDSVTSLCASVALICLLSPASLFDMGLWLSFLSTYGIVSTSSASSKFFKERDPLLTPPVTKYFLKLLSALCFGIIPVAFALPAIWLSYGEIAILSPIANVAFTPILLFVMHSSPLILITAAIPPFATFAGLLSDTFAGIMLKAADLSADYSPIVSLRYPFTPLLLGILVLWLLILALKRTKKYLAYFLPIICVATLFTLLVGCHNRATADERHFVCTSNRNGDAVLLISQNKSLLCDLSGMSREAAGQCTNLLSEHNITTLDTYLVTDYNGKGVEALDYLISTTNIKRLLLPSAETADETLLMELFLNYAQENKINTELYDPHSNGSIDFYGFELKIKRLCIPMANAKNPVAITFSDEDQSIAYVGLGGWATEEGDFILSEIFSKDDPILFGSYGMEKKLHQTALTYKDDATLFFASEPVFNLCSDNLSPKADSQILDGKISVQFN